MVQRLGIYGHDPDERDHSAGAVFIAPVRMKSRGVAKGAGIEYLDVYFRHARFN